MTSKKLILHIDATGSVVRGDKKVFYYAGELLIM